MTTAPAPSPGRRITHYANEVLLAGIIVGGCAAIYAAVTGEYAPFWFRIWSTVGIFVGSILGYRHEGRLCEQCIAHWPLDPAAEVKRRDRRLRFIHAVMAPFEGRRNRLWLYAAVAFVVLVLIPRPVSTWLNIVLYASLFYLYLAGHTHNRLEPWCPYCRHRGRDDEYFSPEPVTPPAAKIDR